MHISVNMGAEQKIGMYLLFGIPGLLISGALQTEEGRKAARSKPYYVEEFYYEGEPLVHGFDTFDEAKKHALKRTAGMYPLNGQLNDKEAKIYETGGKLVETVTSGLSESKYNEIKAERESKGGTGKVVSSFTWRS